MRRGRLLILIVLVLVLGLAGLLFVSGGLGGGEETAEEEVLETPTPIPTAIPTVKILIAVQQLPRGLQIPPGAVDMREWPATSVPANAFIIPDGVDPQVVIQEQIIGKVARSDIAIEQPILGTLLVPDLTQIAAQGSDAAAVLPQGLVAISVPMDRLSGVAYAIQDGDRVDVIVSFLLVDVDEDFQSILPNQILPAFFGTFTEEGSRTTTNIAGQTCVAESLLDEIVDAADSVSPCTLGRIDTIPPGELANVVPVELQRPRLVSQRTIESALVLHVGEFPLDGRFIALTSTPTPAPTATAVPDDDQAAPAEGEEGAEAAPTLIPTPTVPDIITLGVTPQDSVTLTWALNSGIDINLALRSARDVPQVPTTSVTLQFMIDTYNITVPPRLPYSLEPAIRDFNRRIPTVTPAP